MAFFLKQIAHTLVLLLLFCSTTQAQTVEDIIEKQFAAMGGKGKLGQLRSARIEAVADVNGIQIKSSTLVLQNQGIRSEQEIQGMKMIQAFDGTTAWMVNPMMGNDQAVKLPAEQHAALKNQMDLTGLYDYQKKGYQVELKKDDEVNGTPV
jgi:hypothetical protein